MFNGIFFENSTQHKQKWKISLISILPIVVNYIVIPRDEIDLDVEIDSKAKSSRMTTLRVYTGTTHLMNGIFQNPIESK